MAGLFPKPPKIPPAPTPKPMPDANDPEAMAARRRSFEEARARGGRESLNKERSETIIASGGSDYSNSKLG